MLRTVAILPVKRFADAKQRLHPPFSSEQRRELAKAMVGDVLEALSAVRGLDGVLMVSGEPAALELARSAGVGLVEDTADAGQSPATLLGIARALEDGAERVLLVPGDCPALDARELDELLAAPEAVVIVPDRHGTGTNALLLSPPGVIAPAFGPGSRARHEQRAEAAGAGYRVAEVGSLGLDVDTDGDLQALASALSARSGGAGRTRVVLDRLTSSAA